MVLSGNQRAIQPIVTSPNNKLEQQTLENIYFFSLDCQADPAGALRAIDRRQLRPDR
jgi:hypothetical protein